MQSNFPTYMTIAQFIEKYPFETRGGLRFRIFSNKKFNEKCIRRIGGKKILIHVEKYFEYIQEVSDEYKEKSNYHTPSKLE